MEEYELLGPQSAAGIYELLRRFGDMRNRVHIENYYGNLERDESKVFTDARLATLESLLSSLWERMTMVYPRPWGDSST